MSLGRMGPRSEWIKTSFGHWFRYRESAWIPEWAHTVLVHELGGKAPRSVPISLRTLPRYTEVRPGDLLVSPPLDMFDLPLVTIAAQVPDLQVAASGLVVLEPVDAIAPDLARLIFHLPEVRSRLLKDASRDVGLLGIPLAVPERLEQQIKLAVHLAAILEEVVTLTREMEALASEAERLQVALLTETFDAGRWSRRPLSEYAALRQDGLCQPGDSLVSQSGAVTRAETARNAAPGLLPVFVTEPGLLTPDFLFWALRAAQVGEELPTHPEGLLDLTVPVPPMAEQMRTVRYLSEATGEAEGLAAHHRETALRLWALHDAAVQSAFSGEGES